MLQRQLSVTEAADMCGVSKSWLNKRRVYGGGPRFAKIAGRVVYDPADLASYLEAHRIDHTTQRVKGAPQ
jgi:hypothetical protein